MYVYIVPTTDYLSLSFSSNKDIKALITTGDGKFYSNGLDLDNFPSYSPEDVRVLFDVNLNTLFKRMLTFPVITIAAINGK